MEIKEVILTTINRKDEPAEIQQGIKKTAGFGEMPVDITRNKVTLSTERDNPDKPSKFENLLIQTNEVIELIASNLATSLNLNPNVSEMEIDFGISFTESLGIKIFELSSEQSISIKIKLLKKP